MNPTKCTFNTRFCFASTSPLKQAEFIYSLTHYAKGTLKNCKSSLTACTFQVSGSFSLPFLGFFSLFPHGTCSLLVSKAYLDLEGGPPVFKQILSFYSFEHTLEATSTGLSPSLVDFSTSFGGDFPRCLVFSMFSRRYLRNLG